MYLSIYEHTEPKGYFLFGKVKDNSVSNFTEPSNP